MDTLIRYPKIYHVGNKQTEGFFSEEAMDNTVYVEEKFDGANFRFGIIHGEFKAGSKRVDLTQYIRSIDWNHPERSDVSKDAGQFQNAILHALTYVKKLRPGYEYIVEYMIPHTLEYDWGRTPTFIGLDIYDTETEKFLSWEEKTQEFRRLGIPGARLVWKGPLHELKEKDLVKMIPKSIYRDGWAEGIVIKDYIRQWFVKVVRPEFREENLKVWGAGYKKAAKKHSKDDSEWFVNAFITKRRVEKIIEKLIDEGKPEGMELMRWLPREVIIDAWEEHYVDVAFSNLKIDTRKIRKLTTNRCREVLKRWLERRRRLLGDLGPGSGKVT